MDADVIVVGGAVAGGALANALGSAGVSTILIEKVTREVNSTRGDNLHPPTLRILDQWGVLAALHADGALPITELGVTHAERGLIARFPLTPQGDGPASRTISVPHDRIEAVLHDCATRWPCVRSEPGTVTGSEQAQDGRVIGARFRPRDTRDEVVLTSRVVVGCDGTQSLVRRQVGIQVDPEPYAHEQVIIGGHGPTELPAALHWYQLHWYLDDFGALAVTSRPNQAFRILLVFRLGQRGDLLRLPDPALRDHVMRRFPMLAALQFAKVDAHVYRLSRHVADRFWAPGAAIVGDAAHATHPAGATGMSLAITGAARLTEQIGPVLLNGGSDTELDIALQAYDAERRPAAATAVESNHTQAMRIWQSDLFRDPDAYAQAINPNAGWGAGGAGWGQDPAALGKR